MAAPECLRTFEPPRYTENMPIFEYRCDECGTRFEKLVRNGQSATCPSCGAVHLTQELSTFAAHASSGAKQTAAAMPACPGGMCRTPDLCGRN
jgi:putative FmdB family regulatory protein